jgi:signal transduction histidine kinase
MTSAAIFDRSSLATSPAPDPEFLLQHLAHELRQPLSTIESIAYYLGLTLPRHDTRSHEQVEKLQQLVEQTNWILADALFFLQATPLRTQRLDLQEVVTQVVMERARSEICDVEFYADEEPAIAMLDPVQAQHLVRSLTNLLAQLARERQAAPAPVRIRCQAIGRPGRITAEFLVTAPGFTRVEIERLGEPFQSRVPAGSGLALPCARRIAEGHGGTIEIEQRPTGEFVFLLTLPAAE